MTLLEMCMDESQKQNRTEVQEMMQEEMQGTAQEEMQAGMQVDAQNQEHPAVQADAQVMPQMDAQEGEQDETQAVKQNLKQNTEKDGASASVKAGGIVVNLPGAKERPILTTVSMRLNPEVKARLQAMARRRHMSLGEFCGFIMADVAQIAEDESEVA